MPARAPLRPPSPILLVALLAALATGAAASLLIGAATVRGPPPVQASQVVLPGAIFADGLLALPMVVLGFFIYRRVTGGSIPLPGRSAVSILVAVLVAILLLAALRAFGGGGPEPTGAVSTGHNSTGSVPPPNSTTTNLTVVSNATPFLFPTLPGWVPFVLLAAIVVVLVVIALPFVVAYTEGRREERRRPSRPESTSEVRVALARAVQALDQGGDPRTVIVRLYGDLLERLSPIVSGIDPETPEEIRGQHLVRLGIHPEAATVLTRLFEEARYSTHALGPEAAEQVREAVEVALADLSRVAVTA
jgi:hypothetical protein